MTPKNINEILGTKFADEVEMNKATDSVYGPGFHLPEIVNEEDGMVKKEKTSEIVSIPSTDNEDSNIDKTNITSKDQDMVKIGDDQAMSGIDSLLQVLDIQETVSSYPN